MKRFFCGSLGIFLIPLLIAFPLVAHADELELAQNRIVRLRAVCDAGLANLDRTLTAASFDEWREAIYTWHQRHADIRFRTVTTWPGFIPRLAQEIRCLESIPSGSILTNGCC